jgi:hypothetical protein
VRDAPRSDDVAGDLLEGVQAIADFLGWKPRRVYRAREEGWSTPIRKRDGLGIYAFKSELREWLKADEALAPGARRVA